MLRSLLPLSVSLVALSAACGGGVREQQSNSNAGSGGHAVCSECMAAGAAGDRDDASSAGSAGADSADSAEGGAGGEEPANAAGAGGASDEVGNDGAAIAEVSFWQTLRIPLELSGSLVAPNAPIISDKDGILRVYVDPDSEFQARALSAVLEWGVGADVNSFESKKAIRAASSHATFASTFNFPLGPEQVAQGSTYSVTLSDPATGRILDRFPKTEHSPLAAQAVSRSNRLAVVVVPFVVGGITPDTSVATLAIFQTRLRSMYPVADVSLTLHPTVTSSIQVGPDKGWDALLDAVYALRAADAPAPDVYYYGLFTPQKSFKDYCVTDCTVGYSIVADADDVESRGSLGLGIFSDGSNRDAPDTMAHELGHALGRDHAPCDVSKQDSGPFPYPGGKIGVWGFDAPHHALLDPALYGDVMGYCSPDWISDFTYSALFERIALVNAELRAKSLGPAHTAPAYRRVLLGADGSLSWGSRSIPMRALSGPVRDVTLLDGGGTALATISVIFRRFADAAGGFFLLPEARIGAPVRSIRVGNTELALPTP
ncbi:MAG: M66 family metalloprotease [Polyangiaceae bacterium]